MPAEKIPLVSVIIPMFNAAKFISQTLESLLYQTLKDFEVVIVDDCSTDNSVEVVESFKPQFNSGGGKFSRHQVAEKYWYAGLAAQCRNSIRARKIYRLP